MQLDSDQIQKVIPHRYPFLMVDRIDECEPGRWARGRKCVSVNEMQFMGHFPDLHVMPGVLILEALAQVGAIAILTAPEDQGKTAFFGGVQKCRFKRKVVPGDCLELYCELGERRGNVGFGSARATVDGKIACVAELMFALE